MSDFNEFTVQPLTHNRSFKYFIYGEVGAPDTYSDMVNILGDCVEGDEFHVYLNTCGGYLSSAIMIYEALLSSYATIFMHVSGECKSAGTLIMLAGSIFEISPYADFMFHNYSGGVIGKGHEMVAQLEAETKLYTKIFKDIYKMVLTPSEIDVLLNGSDLYYDGEEIIARITEYFEIYAARAQLEADEEELEIEEAAKVINENNLKKEKVAAKKVTDAKRAAAKKVADRKKAKKAATKKTSPRKNEHGDILI